MSITWAQALAWRLRRQLLAPPGDLAVSDVVQRLGAVLATAPATADLVVGARSERWRPGGTDAALAAGELVTVCAFRGALHYLSVDDVGAYLALRAAGRQWERRSWQEHYGLGPADWPGFRTAVREALGAGPLGVRELGERLGRDRAYRHLRPIFDDDAWTLLKALMWQGEVCLGPAVEGRASLQRPSDNPRWRGIWDLEEAGPHAVLAYLRGYGPATAAHVHHWLGAGLSAGRRRLDRWLAQLGDRVVPVEVEGERALVLREDRDALASARPDASVLLLPGHDPWVMGPGTHDRRVVPPGLRAAVTRGRNLVVARGVVCGTWSVSRQHEVEVAWSTDRGLLPRGALAAQVERLAELSGRPLRARLPAP